MSIQDNLVLAAASDLSDHGVINPGKERMNELRSIKQCGGC
jgi:hypothetical protein